MISSIFLTLLFYINVAKSSVLPRFICVHINAKRSVLFLMFLLIIMPETSITVNLFFVILQLCCCFGSTGTFSYNRMFDMLI